MTTVAKTIETLKARIDCNGRADAAALSLRSGFGLIDFTISTFD
jgi:hypothetical protein